jgi:hypothetical protein
MRFDTNTTTLFLALQALIAFSGVARSADSLNRLTEAEKAAGWKLLFDGQTKEGWRNYGKDAISNGWQVKDDALVRASNGAGDIITEEEYGNYELSLEYRISPGGNSGIMFGVQEIDGPPWHTGPEIQIQDNKEGHDPQKSGWLYQFYKSDADATKPAGEWNQIRFVFQDDGKSALWLNGVKYYEFEKGSEEWKEKLAKSKFAGMPKFAQFNKGHICLQDHGDEVAYRNIKIKPL